MAFLLYKGSSSSTVPMERYIASGAIAENMPVALAAGTTTAELGKVIQLSGGAAATEALYGIAACAAADAAEVLIIPVSAGQVWVADAVANANVLYVGSDNYLTGTTLTVTVAASTANGRKCQIVGQLGAAADKKYLVRLGNFGPTVAQMMAFTLDKSAGAFDTATAVFTAPYAMRIDDVIVTAQATSANGTVTVKKATDALGAAIVCAVDGVVNHLASGVVVANKAFMSLAAGDVVNAIAAGDAASGVRAIVTVIGHRTA